MRTKALIVLTAFLYATSPCPLPALQAAPADAPDAVQQGIDLYNQLEYEQAIDALQSALARSDLELSQRVRAMSYLGVIHVAMNHEQEAVSCFVALLKIEPDVQLEPALRSPKVMEVLKAARESYVRELRASDVGAPVIQVSPVEGKAPYGRACDLTLRISDRTRIVQPQIFFRKKGDTSYAFLPLQFQGGEVYHITVPSGAMTADALEFYIVAIDEAGNASIEGSAGMPLTVPVAPNPQIKPWYKKWWVWTAVAVVAGGATAAGVLLASNGGSSSSPATGSATVHFGP
jgi:tetratricopeptide (TPR) repeat protein